ncbi:MAG: hypothetical protein V3U75_13025 [Methylococcaceae bacterium]
MTHTFELILEDLSLQGEINFTGSGVPELSINSPINLSLSKYTRIGSFLSRCAELFKDYGEITKIEVRKKEEV